MITDCIYITRFYSSDYWLYIYNSFYSSDYWLYIYNSFYSSDYWLYIYNSFYSSDYWLYIYNSLRLSYNNWSYESNPACVIILSKATLRSGVILSNTTLRSGVILSNTTLRSGVILSYTTLRSGVILSYTTLRSGVILSNTTLRSGVILLKDRLIGIGHITSCLYNLASWFFESIILLYFQYILNDYYLNLESITRPPVSSERFWAVCVSTVRKFNYVYLYIIYRYNT